MRALLTCLLICWLGVAQAFAATPQFPALTGRVVDNAHILSPAATQTLTANLEAFEQKTGHQLVVTTLKSLQGYEIEEYGYQLGRHWAIGRKGKDDGVLLIVAPNERRVRIEVGYGLEGDLTDALSSLIIQRVILPEFRKGDMQTGTVNGARAIIGTLGGEPYAIPATPTGEGEVPLWLVILILAFIIFIRLRFGIGVLAVGSYGSGWGGSGSGGGFSGGGGSFGGGGSTGRW